MSEQRNSPLLYGYSLLELLLVLALVSILMSLALPQWQGQQVKVRRQVAWLNLQHIALAQVEYQHQMGVAATDIANLGVTDKDAGYDYLIRLEENAVVIIAQVRAAGPQQNDKACWQLIWHSRDGEYALDSLGAKTVNCR